MASGLSRSPLSLCTDARSQLGGGKEEERNGSVDGGNAWRCSREANEAYDGLPESVILSPLSSDDADGGGHNRSLAVRSNGSMAPLIVAISYLDLSTTSPLNAPHTYLTMRGIRFRPGLFFPTSTVLPLFPQLISFLFVFPFSQIAAVIQEHSRLGNLCLYSPHVNPGRSMDPRYRNTNGNIRVC